VHAIRMDITIVVIAAVVLTASVKAPVVIPVATVSAAMESLVTNVAAKAKLSVSANC
jgi:hypothetical protein